MKRKNLPQGPCIHCGKLTTKGNEKIKGYRGRLAFYCGCKGHRAI